MSGGFFEYQDMRLIDLAEPLRCKIALNRQKPDWASDYDINYSENFINEMSEVYDQLIILMAKLHRIDWVLSADDGESDYERRLAIDLSKVESDDPCKDDEWLELARDLMY